MALSKSELEQIAADVTLDEDSRDKARQLLKATAGDPDLDAEGFIWAAEMIAKSIRLFSSPEVRHEFFEREREVFKKDLNASRSFTPEREALRAKRNVYSFDGNRILGQAFDEDIESLRKTEVA
jgi:hypothetical protein